MGTITVEFPKNNISIEADCVASDVATELAVLQFGPEGGTHPFEYPKMSLREKDGSLTFCGGYEGNQFRCSSGVISDLGHVICGFKPSCLVSNPTGPGICGGPCIGSGSRELIGVVAGGHGQGGTRLVPLSGICFFFLHQPRTLPQIE